MPGRSSERLVGRADPLGRVRRAIADARAGRATTLLVAGAAGMGKTSLLRAALAAEAEHHDDAVAWGTCPGSGPAPGFWPWTQAGTGLVRTMGEEAVGAAGTERGLLAALVPALGAPEPPDDSERGRLLLLDAAAAWLRALAADRTVVVVLDDLQWMDDSSLALLELVAADPRPARLCVLGGYRPDEATPATRRVAGLADHVDHVQLAPLADADAGRLVAAVAGTSLVPDRVDTLVRRAGGHPLFLRELALAAAAGTPDHEVPALVREAVTRRAGALGAEDASVLAAAATAGHRVEPDVVAAATGRDPADVAGSVDRAVAAGLLVTGADGSTWFVHDVFREVLAEEVPAPQRPSLHRAIGEAMAARPGASAAEVAGQLRAGLGAGGDGAGAELAAAWSLAAAEADRATLALADAALHLARLRAAVASTGVELTDRTLLEVLLAEADLLSRSGRSPDARGLLRAAREVARRTGDAPGTARVALATADLGSRFAVRRDELVAELEEARTLVADAHPALAARVTAVLARELAHSVTEDRGRAGPLADEALALGRGTGEDEVLAECLLAKHDVLWRPGTADERATVAAELAGLALRSGRRERRAQALLLHANALLEGGRAGFAPLLDEALDLLGALGQPRHRYTLLTRRACVALLHGDTAEAERLIEEAAALGDRLREPDTGNVRMSQRLELVRLRSDPAELLAFAAGAVAHWTGAPVHAHAVAAGFSARAGDLDRARHHVATVADLGTWRADRSYLWSVFVRELGVAATATADAGLAGELLAEVRPLAGTCGVNGALVAFAGCHSHTAGLLAEGLGQRTEAARLLAEAVAVYERLGAGLVTAARADLARVTTERARAPAATLVRRGPVWEIAWAGRAGTVRDCKGMHDIASLVTRPGREVAALDLAGGGVPDPAEDPILDRTAVASYRDRLRDLSADREEAEARGDARRLAEIEAEHDALAAELGAGTGLGGRARAFANRPAERARKAVTARIRDAVRRIDAELPDLAAHLDQHLVTGTRCRYTGEEAWSVTT